MCVCVGKQILPCLYPSSTFSLCLRLAKIKEWVDAHDPGALVIPVSGALESKLQDMSDEEKEKYCQEQKTQR